MYAYIFPLRNISQTKFTFLPRQDGNGEPRNVLDGIERKAQSADIMAGIAESPEVHVDSRHRRRRWRRTMA